MFVFWYFWSWDQVSISIKVWFLSDLRIIWGNMSGTLYKKDTLWTIWCRVFMGLSESEKWTLFFSSYNDMMRLSAIKIRDDIRGCVGISTLTILSFLLCVCEYFLHIRWIWCSQSRLYSLKFISIYFFIELEIDTLFEVRISFSDIVTDISFHTIRYSYPFCTI